MKSPDVILVVESVKQSIIKDTFTFVMVTSLIGIGVFLESTAMQWFGAFMAMVGILGAIKKYSQKQTMTPQQAADYLRDNYVATSGTKQ
jgi:hypothetical protein